MSKKVKIVRDGTNQSYVSQHSATIVEEGKRPKKESSYMKNSFYGGSKMP